MRQTGIDKHDRRRKHQSVGNRYNIKTQLTYPCGVGYAR